MNVAELHPDDLLDKEAMGEITAGERTLLDAHLKKCASCRLERAARDDFRAEFASVGRAQVASMVSSVLDGAAGLGAGLVGRDSLQATPDPTAIPVVPTRAPQRRRHAKFPILIAAALLIVSVGAAGALSTEARRAFFPHALVPGGVDTRTSETVPNGNASRASAQRGSVQAPQAEAPAPVIAPVADVPAMPETPVVTETPSAVPVARRKVSSSTGGSAIGSRAMAPSAAPVAPTPVALPTVAPAATQHTAASVFDEANDARRRGEYGTAIARYREIEDAFPGTPESVATQVVLGQLLLDRGSPADALRRFDAYVAHGEDALREEAMVGRAVALGRLARSGDERDAWTAVLAAYPRSHRADQARARIAALGGK